MDYLIIFILGTIIGSFLNVCIYRIPKSQSIVYPPSHCANCKINLKPYDLIPVLSYTLLKGRCRYCREKISVRYSIVEFLTGILYVSIYVKYGVTLDAIKYIIMVSILIVIGMIDLETTNVYFKTTLTGSILAIIFLALHAYMGLPVINYIYGGVIGGGTLSLITIITKGGMGGGDAEICFICGLFLGLKLTLLMLFLSFVIGSVVGVALIALSKKTRKDYVPFGPFIVLASIITILWGQGIITWYLL
ncbi:leader peptidase (prepilin peptidase)/N-methyltransferase [Clostridium pascui]|uniref:prepilin peptidase n=1 Tax=Clostridium pascui TaxID=46609 RepID=UPI00195CBBFA|nr:A24 family peptidase [Clostridium pascui]MBM7871906.1 leader peptidase (prepilin peptidase)/N-methyltransferase [Clostridium pascui]